jgi:hypothetical protein
MPTATERRPLAEVLADVAEAQQRIIAASPEDKSLGRLLSWYTALCEEAAEQDRWSFCRLLVITQDDKDKKDPFKRFPDMEYLKHLAEVWTEVAEREVDGILLIKKSRQMMVSWFAISMVLWSCLFEKGRTIGWQSKKAEDANWMLRRIHGVWEQLPEEVRNRHPVEVREGELRFPDRKNVVMAVPEGPEKPRQFTWSLFISDEAAFQTMSRETYVAVQPAITGGGMYVMISSAAPSFFINMFEDRE